MNNQTNQTDVIMPKTPFKPPELPKYLKNRESIIRRILDSSPETVNETANYVPAIWSRRFKDSDHEADLDAIFTDLPKLKEGRHAGRIEREYVFSLLGTSTRKWFLGVYIWGGGIRQGGIAASNARKVLDSDPNCVRLSRMISDAKQGNIRGAYGAGKDLGGLGASYLSKLLYFAGRDAGFEPIPLILDTRVAEALRRLGLQEGWRLGLFAQMSQSNQVELDYSSYERYINCMHIWANQLKCPRADYLEFFLYDRRKDIPEG